jgi:multiple sugar transport system substrate-binding protein
MNMDRKTGKVSRKTYEDRLRHLIDTLRNDILNGSYAPGSFLPSEKALVDTFQLSNKSVRKGLEQLVEEGLIVKIDRVGSQVVKKMPVSVTPITLGYTLSIERDLALSVLLEDFHALYPSIRVRPLLIRSSKDYISAAKEYADNGLLDVLILNNLHAQQCFDHGQSNLFLPVESDPNLYRFAEDAFRKNGKMLARPILFSPIILAYNRDHFKEAGVPEPDSSWTWDDAIRHAASLTVPGVRHGLYFYLLSDNRWPAFLLQSGMRFEKDGGRMRSLKGTRMLDSIRLCKSIIRNRDVFPSYLSENSDDVNQLFMQGKVSMIMTNYMTINDFKDSDLNYDISPLPYLYEPRSLMNAIGVAISSSSQHREAAAALSAYLVSERAQRIIRKHTLSLPACKKAAESFEESGLAMNRPSRFGLFREIMSSYRPHSELNLTFDSFNALRQLLKQYWSGLITEDELCERAELL